jgi:diaminohydroxyphosphoribosylaminopyrimidine deaminase/5-amino-6-(5-phosphoribosylamino)uracil reductase
MTNDQSQYMQRAFDLARRGQGAVEPNPMVGCVIARGDAVIAAGWHQRFGGPHAEVEALHQAGEQARGATMYVSLEPCCHHGKTPPCTLAIIRAGIARVVAAMHDPFPQVAGGGAKQLRDANIEVEIGLLEAQARRLNAPYLKLIQHGRPWVIAKWAMSLDGRMTTPAGESKWISNEQSRAIVHQLRGRMDAIIVGRGTVEADAPLLTARPPGPRIATRIVLDGRASLSSESQLIRTLDQAPVLVAATPQATEGDVARLRSLGCEVVINRSTEPKARWNELLDELGRRRMTNVLVEGGAKVLGGLIDAKLVDEVHVFIAPRRLGAGAMGPAGGVRIDEVAQTLSLEDAQIEQLGDDAYIQGRVRCSEY